MESGRTLLLLRHGKSAWPDDVEDHDRPLAPRGIGAATKMAAYIESQGLCPALALVSTALRTRQTWDLLERHLPGCEIRFERRLYEAPGSTIIELVRNLDENAPSVLLVGHNPGLQEAAMALLIPGTTEAASSLARKFPTAALAVLSFSGHVWAQAAPRTATLERFVTPRTL